MRKFSLVTAIQTVKPAAVAQLSFGELLGAYCARPKGAEDELRLRKWVEAFGHLSAWEITSAQLATAAQAMLESGRYKPSSINRDMGGIGSAYKWIIRERSAPAGFASPTVSVHRFEEKPRVMLVTPEQIQRLQAMSLINRDKRFALFVHLLIDTGARKSERAA